MTLAVMMAADEDALICDFAETYHILDYRALPVPLRAALAYGLRGDSRIKVKMAGWKDPPKDMVAAMIVDNLSAIRYALTAKKGDPKPFSLTEYIAGTAEEKDTAGFISAEEYENARKRILMRIGRNG